MVRDLIQSFLKARKNLKLYPENNPIFVNTIEDVFKRTSELLSERDGITLRITRNEIHYNGEQVYEGSGKDDNLALFFFRDGLRELTLKPGIEKAELRRFLDIISADLERENAEDDLVTLLWQSDFSSITYKVDEALVLEEDMGYEESATEQAREGADTGEGIKQAYDEAKAAPDPAVDIQIALLTGEDLKYLQAEIEMDGEDKTGKAVEIIFGMLAKTTTVTEIRDMAQVLCNAIDYCMQQGNLKALARIVTRTKAAIGRIQNDEVRGLLRTVSAYASSQGTVRGLGVLLEAGRTVNEEALSEYVAVLEPGAVGSFMALLGEVRTPSVREIIMKTLVRIGRGNVEAVARGLKDRREGYVAATVNLLRAIGGRQAADSLMRFPMHPDARVRREVVRAIGEIGGPDAAGAMMPYLDDAEPAVRAAAVRALAANGSELSRMVLMTRASDKGALSMEYEDLRIYFEALAKWPDSEMVGFMEGILRESSLFNRAKRAELKACAAYSLGLMGVPGAVPILQKYAGSGNKLIADQAGIALRRYGHGR